MDLFKQIASVARLSEYIELTQDVDTKHKDVKIAFNMSTILSLKKIRSLEIEHFNKCDGIGAAFKLLDRMLGSPPSKTWALLGPEVIGLIQYWLDAVRKYLISHHINWWIFLKEILGFIKKIRQKDHCLSNILVEEVAESMLDLATSGKLNVHQRYEILHTFNLFCAESSREIRLALKTQFEPYFIRLSTILATCGHLPAQFAALEALLRWLQPRHDPTARKEAAGKWFLPHLYSKAAVDVFLTRSWMNFFQDARDFLNSHNSARDLVTSVICRRLCVGEQVVISGEERRQSWLDINCGSRSITVTLEPQLLEALGVQHAASCETLRVLDEEVEQVTLHREGNAVTISLSSLVPPTIVPSLSPVFPLPCDVTLVLPSRSPLPRVDAALRRAFHLKYRLMLDIQNVTITSPETVEGVRSKNSIEDNARFSHPVKEKRRKPQSGFVAWSKRFSNLKSPSTASTASLAQLHDKLANLPYYEFTKEPVSVCAQPELSVVNELNESQISNSLDSKSTVVLRKLREQGVRNFRAHVEDRKSQSDGDIRSKDEDDINNADDHRNKTSQSDKYVNRSKIVERDVSSLFAATIGSNDNSIISATIERLPKDKEINTDNLIDLLVQEALQSKGNKEQDLSDRINAEDGKNLQEESNQDNETIEDTQYTGPMNMKTAGLRNFVTKSPKNKAVSKSTSDESNTEAIVETPVSYVSIRRRYQKRSAAKKCEAGILEENVTVAVATVEDFFSQHFAENQMGDVIISPTLAKKINESSSESSDDLLMKNIDDNIDDNFDIRNEEMPDFDIVECLNDIVDKVCSDFEKCTEYLENQGAASEILNMAQKLNTQVKQNAPLEDKITSDNEPAEMQNKNPSKNTKPKKKQAIKLKFTSSKTKPKPKAKGKLKLEPVSKMSTILENNESDGNKTSSSEIKKTELIESEKKTPLTRRKRKLYSPKDDEIQFDRSNNDISTDKPDPVPSDNEDEISLALLKMGEGEKLVTPKTSATCYKEIEKERKRYKRIRNRKSKTIESPVSPRSKKLDDVFEKLKDNIEIHENEKITLVDKKSNKDVAIFNFTSDSEDEDFKQKKKEVQKRTSTTTIGSGTSVISTRRGRARTKVKYTEDEKESANETSKPTKRKRATSRKASKTKSIKAVEIKVDRPTDLVDEKMREAAPETLNTSFIAVNVDNNVKEPVPSVKPPELELITDEDANIDVEDCIQKTLENEKVSDKIPTKVGKSSTKEEKKSTKENIRPKIVKNVNTKQKNLEDNEFIRDDEGTVSPLPCLVVENEVHTNKLDDSLTTNFMQKIQKAYKDGPDVHNDTIATQNMLSDNDKAISPQTNISDVLGKMFEDDTSNNSKKKSSDKENSVIDDSVNSDIITTGNTKKRHNLRLKIRNINDSSVKSNSVKGDTTIKSTKINNTESQHVINESQKSRNKSVLSQIDGINYDEIICIEDIIETRSKPVKSRSVSKEVEIINITANTEEKSDRSIATDGITGHGESNEFPPSPKLLNEKLTPREIEDMDPNIREYFIELSNKVNSSRSFDKILNKDRDERIKNKTIEKLVEEDDVCEPRPVEHTFNKVRTFIEESDYDISKMLPSRKESSENSSHGSQQTPVVSITRLSSKEISKWLPSATSTPESSVKSARKTRQTPRRSIRVAKNITTKSTPETSFETAKKSKETYERNPKVTRYRKSQISPVKLDDFIPKRQILLKDISNSKDETIDSVDVETVSKLDSIAKKYFVKPNHESSPISRGEKSEQSTPRIVAPKRKSPVAKVVEAKRRKLDEDFRMEEKVSRQSSNVEDWLKNISSISRVDNTDATDEAVQNLMEKLDTTLEEIHQNTTKDFISMFVEAQRRLEASKEERRRAYRESAIDILTNVTQLIDRHFAQMDQRAEERESSFMSWLRARAGELLRRDDTHKRAMVALLREDAQATVTRRGREHSE